MLTHGGSAPNRDREEADRRAILLSKCPGQPTSYSPWRPAGIRATLRCFPRGPRRATATLPPEFPTPAGTGVAALRLTRRTRITAVFRPWRQVDLPRKRTSDT